MRRRRRAPELCTWPAEPAYRQNTPNLNVVKQASFCRYSVFLRPWKYQNQAGRFQCPILSMEEVQAQIDRRALNGAEQSDVLVIDSRRGADAGLR